MATVSGFGFSGTDHPNTIFENLVGRYFGKKRAEDTAALNYAYAQRYAENGPLWSVTGLRKAGLNPILAASSGFSPSMGSAVQVTDNVQSNGGSSGGESPFAISRNNRLVKMQEKQAESTVDTQKSQQRLNDAQAKATTMKAQQEVEESKARIAELRSRVPLNNQRFDFNEQSGGFESTLMRDAHRLGSKLDVPFDFLLDRIAPSRIGHFDGYYSANGSQGYNRAYLGTFLKELDNRVIDDFVWGRGKTKDDYRDWSNDDFAFPKGSYRRELRDGFRSLIKRLKSFSGK